MWNIFQKILFFRNATFEKWKYFLSVWLYYENCSRKYFQVFGFIMKILIFYKLFTFSQLPNKFYNRKFQYINLEKQNSKQKTILSNTVSSVKLREGGRKSEWLRKKERQIEKEIKAIGHGWVDLKATAATMRSREKMTRSVMGGGDEIVSRQFDPNRGCMHGGGAVGWGRRFRLHQCVENKLHLGWVEDEISFRWIGLGWRQSSLGGSGLGGSADGCDLAGVSGGAISPVLGATRPCFWCDLLVVFLSLSLSLSSIFLGWNSFEGKIQTEMVLQGQKAYFAVNGNDFLFDPIFLAHPNNRIYGKAFPEVIWSQNKHSLKLSW